MTPLLHRNLPRYACNRIEHHVAFHVERPSQILSETSCSNPLSTTCRPGSSASRPVRVGSRPVLQIRSVAPLTRNARCPPSPRGPSHDGDIGEASRHLPGPGATIRRDRSNWPKCWAIRPRTPSGSSVTQTGTPTTTLGAGRPRQQRRSREGHGELRKCPGPDGPQDDAVAVTTGDVEHSGPERRRHHRERRARFDADIRRTWSAVETVGVHSP